MKVFLTGTTGYIGGSVAAALLAAGHEVRGLIRSEARTTAMRERGIEPVSGSLDDTQLLRDAAGAADVVVNAAQADHRGAAEAMLAALAGSDKPFIHTSGSSIVGTASRGEPSDDIYDETTPVNPAPGRAARVALNQEPTTPWVQTAACAPCVRARSCTGCPKQNRCWKKSNAGVTARRLLAPFACERGAHGAGCAAQR